MKLVRLFPELPMHVAPAERWRSRFRGCLVGGAVGDALGAPVEFMTRGLILARYGEPGIAELDVASSRMGAITDDTQMTMFTGEGLLQALSLRRSGIATSPEIVVHRAYLRWLATQGLTEAGDSSGGDRSGWLIGVPELHARRAPGHTCVHALSSGRIGTPDERLNDSKGCGGVMRAAPCALVKEWDPFELGCKVAAITHGHSSGYLAAGALALIIRDVLAKCEIVPGVFQAIKRLEGEAGGAECVAALREAIALWNANGREGDVEELGKGWVAEEALAIAVYSAMVGERYLQKGLMKAVNHSGDSDSTGAIAGNILCALLGENFFSRLYSGVELRAELVRLADDLFDAWVDEPGWSDRYPVEAPLVRPPRPVSDFS